MASTTTIKNKVSKTATKAANSISKNPIPYLYIGAGILGLIVVSRVLKAANNFNFGNNPNDGGGNNSTTGGNNVPFGATISRNQATNIAAALHQAMVVWHGTDEDTIFSLLTGKKPKDFAMISEEFGKPRYDDMGDAYWPFPQQNLTYWLHSELNTNEITRLRQLMPGVLN